MSRHKAYGLSPRDCLKTTLFQKWQRMVAPPGESLHHHQQGAAADHDTVPAGNRPSTKRRVYSLFVMAAAALVVTVPQCGETWRVLAAAAADASAGWGSDARIMQDGGREVVEGVDRGRAE